MLQVTRRLLCLAALIASISAFDWAVYTSRDIAPGSQVLVSQEKGDYYVYAAFSKHSVNPSYFSKVLVIDGSSGFQMSVYDIANSAQGTNQLNAFKVSLSSSSGQGLRVWDQNSGVGNSLPYVLYIVKNKNDIAVYSAGRSENSVITSSSGVFSAELTVINAEPYFTMSNFDIAGGAEVEIFTAPYASADAAHRVFHITEKEAGHNSFCTILGPIATLYNSKFTSPKFSFQVDSRANYNRTLAVPSFVSVSTPGYAKIDAYYSHPYDNLYPQYQEYTYMAPANLKMWVRGSFTSATALTTSIEGATTNSYYYSSKKDETIEKKSVRKVRLNLARPSPYPNFFFELKALK